MVDHDEEQRYSAVAGDGQIERTRERLIDATLEILGRKGYEDARVEDICQAAGSARATFYRHFSGKDDVFDVLLDRLVEELDALVTRLQAVTPDSEGYDTLRQLVADMMGAAERWAPVVEALDAPRRIPDESRSRSVAALIRISTVLGRAISDGGGGAGDPWMEGLALIGLFEGFGHQVRTWDVSLDRAAMLDAVALVSLRMLHPALDVGAIA